jgi:dolichol-phosphate mannosyltransferase
MRKKDLISIIIPVYNEGKNISTALLLAEKDIKFMHDYYVVYDHEDDTSIPYVTKLLQRKIPITLLKNDYDKGVANAVKTGFNHALGSIIVIMAPDGADDPGVINAMYTELQKGFDIVCATRYTRGGKRLEKKTIKYLLSQLVGITTPLVLGIPTSDLTNGFKMYTRKVIQDIPMQSNKGWEFSMELVIKAYHKGFLISEVPAISKPRSYGVSKFKLLSWLPLYLKWLMLGISNRFNQS